MVRVVCVAVRLGRDDEAATSIEYAVLAALIAVVIIGSVALLGSTVAETYRLIDTGFAGAV